MQIDPAHPSWISVAGKVCEFASVFLGILGTWLMSRRYVGIGESLGFAWKLLRGKERNARQFFVSRAKLNEGVPDSAADMSLGVILVFWGFFVQLISLILK